MKKLLEKTIIFKYEAEEGYDQPDFLNLLKDGIDIIDYRESTTAKEIIYDCPFSVGDEVVLILDGYSSYPKGTIGTVYEILSDYAMLVEMKTYNGKERIPEWGGYRKKLTDTFVKVRR